MFGSFVARRNRGSSSHHPPPRPDPLPRSSSSRLISGGISALLSSSGAQSPAHRSYQSSSSQPNNSFTAAAAAGFPCAPYGQPQYRQSTAQYNPPSRHDQESMSFGAGQGSGGRSGRGPLPSMLPGTPGAGRSRRKSGKPNDNNSSTDGRPQKRIRTGEQSNAGTVARAFVRSQSAKSRSGSAALLPCDGCDSKFKQQGQLNRHIKRVHLGIRNFDCGNCKKKFASRSDRDRHEEVHKKLRYFSCAYCNFESLTVEHLQIHLGAVHTERQNFRCPHCNFESLTKEHLREHLRAEHAKREHFRCPHCNHESLAKKDLRRHILAAHPESFSEILPRKRSVHHKAR